MADAASYDFIKDCLFKFDYPNIQSRHNEDLCDILSIPNRPFLVKWILKKISDTLDESLLESEESLGELVYCYGFCTESEKQGFINGDISVKQQSDILYRMFMYLCNIQKEDLPSRSNTIYKQVDLLEYLDTTDTNLFSAFGPKVKLSSEGRQKKYEEYQKEIETYKSLCDNQVSKENSAYVDNMNNVLTRALDNCESQFSEFKKNTALFENYSIDMKRPDKFKITGEDVMAGCEKNSKLIKQYLQSLNDTCIKSNDSNEGLCEIFKPVNRGNNEGFMMKTLANLYLKKDLKPTNVSDTIVE